VFHLMFKRVVSGSSATPTSKGFHQDRSSARPYVLRRIVGIESEPNVPAIA
jgi:hypothetical protein